MKVKACYACVHVTGHLNIRIEQDTPFFNKILNNFWGALDPTPSEEGDTTSPHSVTDAAVEWYDYICVR